VFGAVVNRLLEEEAVPVSFPGVPLAEAYHRKLADMDPVPIPADAEALYEATVFAADNNALELRSLSRSGGTNVPEVKAARDSFLKQELFIERGLWDRYMFDGDPTTAFYVSRRWHASGAINRGSLRLDLGAATRMDELVINVGSEYALQPWKTEEAVFLETSLDLAAWTAHKILAARVMRVKLEPSLPIRYVRFRGFPERILEVEGFLDGKPLERSGWRGSHLFSPFSRITVFRAWESSFKLDQIPRGSYLAVALEGMHGIEGAYAAVRVDGKPVGAPDRSPSYPGNPWENTIDNTASHYTYYVPLDEDMIDRQIDVVVLGIDDANLDFKPRVYITAYPAPYVAKRLLLYR